MRNDGKDYNKNPSRGKPKPGQLLMNLHCGDRLGNVPTAGTVEQVTGLGG